MTTKAEKIKMAMRRAGILDRDEAEAAIDFVRDLLDIEIDDTEINEPYATSSINEMKQAHSTLTSLASNVLEVL